MTVSKKCRCGSSPVKTVGADRRHRYGCPNCGLRTMPAATAELAAIDWDLDKVVQSHNFTEPRKGTDP